mgnify:FL=1
MMAEYIALELKYEIIFQALYHRRSGAYLVAAHKHTHTIRSTD